MLWATQLIRISLKYASLTGKAFESDGGLHGVRVTRCYLDRPQQSPKLKWEGVISINNVENRDHGMRVWRANGIGKEKFVSRSDFENLENFSLLHLTVVKDALHPKQCFSPTKARENTQKKQRCFKSRSRAQGEWCRRPWQPRWFIPLSRRRKYQTISGTFLPSKSLRCKQAQVCLGTRNVTGSVCAKLFCWKRVFREYRSGAPSSLSAPSQGWALKSAVTSHRRLTKEQKKYLTYLVLIGEQTGRNLSPDEVSMSMRKARGPDGVCLFSADNYPSPKQVASFTSRLAKMSALGMAVILSEEDENDNSTNRLPQKTSQVTGSCVYQASHYVRNLQHLQNG